MDSEFEILDNNRPITGRGGYRPNSGRKKKEVEEEADYVSFTKAKARNESAKADLAELEYKIKTGQYVSRIAVQQASATAFATIAQSLRSIPDNLERKLGLAPEVAAEVGVLIDAALDDLSNELEVMAGGEPTDV